MKSNEVSIFAVLGRAGLRDMIGKNIRSAVFINAKHGTVGFFRSGVFLKRLTNRCGPRCRSADGAARRPYLHYFPVALMRLACEGSVPRVMLTVMPGFKSVTLARRPFTLISVN